MDKLVIIEVGPELKTIINRYMAWAEIQCQSTQATVAYCNSMGNLLNSVANAGGKNG